MDGGDLHSYLVNPSNNLDNNLKLKICRDIASGMLHLALEGIIHKDLAARNILLTKTLEAKVSDFGLSRIADNTAVVYSKSDVGPLKWMSPEAIRKKKYSEKSDVWSYGTVCYEVYARKEPFEDLDAIQAATSVVMDGLRCKLPNNAPPFMHTLLNSCFEVEPEKRPTFKEIGVTFVENGVI